MLPYFVIVFPLLCFFFLILYFPVCHQKALQGIFFFFLNGSYLTFWQYCLWYKQGMEGLDTQSKNGRMELEEGISSCRILFQEGSIGNSYWTDTYFLLNSFISTEHGLFQSKPHNSQFETGHLLHCTHLQHALCTTTPTRVFLGQWQLSEQIWFYVFHCQNIAQSWNCKH